MLKSSGLAVILSCLLLSGSPAAADNFPTAPPASEGFSQERLAQIRTLLKKEIDADRMPGAVVMIARDGKLVYSEAVGFQDKAAGKPLGKDAIFRIYSMTKPFVSVVTMMLVEEGQLQLADPVTKYLPGFAEMKVLVTDKDGNSSIEAARRPITIQDLLRHTAGYDYGESTTLPEIKAAYAETGLYRPDGILYDSRGETAEAKIAAFSKVPLAYQPGTNWKYSKATDLLGRILEKVTGKRLGDLLAERLFRPLNMPDTGYFVPAGNQRRIAEALPVNPLTGGPNDRLYDVTAPPANDPGDSGAVSTAADYMRFCQMLLNDGELDGKRYLSPTTIRLMTSDQLGNRTTLPQEPGELLMGVQGYTFGLGFMVRRGPGIASVPGTEGEYLWGGAGGTFFWVEPKSRLAVVVMAQTPGPIRQYYRRLFKQVIEQAIVAQ